MTYNYSDVSLQEFPGEISLILYTGPCSCRCPWCFNKELLTKKPLSFKQMKDSIDEHIEFITAICFTGGEPLLNPFFNKAVKYAKSKGLKIKVNTNALVYKNNPSNLFISYIDYMNVSLKGLPIDYQQVLINDNVTSSFLNCNFLEYSFVYSPTLHPRNYLDKFHSFLKKQISFSWKTMFSSKWSQPDAFTISQIQTGNCLNKQYNFARKPTEQECLEVAKIFSDIPLKEINIETKEFGRKKIDVKNI